MCERPTERLLVTTLLAEPCVLISSAHMTTPNRYAKHNGFIPLYYSFKPDRSRQKAIIHPGLRIHGYSLRSGSFSFVLKEPNIQLAE